MCFDVGREKITATNLANAWENSAMECRYVYSFSNKTRNNELKHFRHFKTVQVHSTTDQSQETFNQCFLNACCNQMAARVRTKFLFFVSSSDRKRTVYKDM